MYSVTWNARSPRVKSSIIKSHINNSVIFMPWPGIYFSLMDRRGPATIRPHLIQTGQYLIILRQNIFYLDEFKFCNHRRAKTFEFTRSFYKT